MLSVCCAPMYPAPSRVIPVCPAPKCSVIAAPNTEFLVVKTGGWHSHHPSRLALVTLKFKRGKDGVVYTKPCITGYHRKHGITGQIVRYGF